VKRLILATLVCLITFGNSFGQSQGEMNNEEYRNYKKAESELNTVYQRIIREYNTDPEFVNNLKAAQRLWIQFRDAELKARYPDKGQYGSVLPMCRYIFLTQLTEERINTLKVWLEGIPEGDVCSGSVKTKIEGDEVRISLGSSDTDIKNFGVKVLNVPAQGFEDFSENGKVAIDITTDLNGKVLSATYQPRGSTTNNRKMIELARKKAFELIVTSGGTPQKGTIIFNFRAKG
jgi:uncharacterized protein YecT (DUF1311 family)